MADASELDALSLLIDRFNDEKRCAVELAQFEQAFDRAKADLGAAKARYQVAQMDRDQAVMACRSAMRKATP